MFRCNILNFKSFFLHGVTIGATVVAVNFGSTLSASAAVITSSFGGDIIDFSAVPFQFAAGPVQIGGSVDRDIVWTSTYSWAIFFNGSYGLNQNGSWTSARNSYSGLNTNIGSMTFTFNDGLVSSVGGFINYAVNDAGQPQGRNPIIEALGVGGIVLENYDIEANSPIRTSGNDLGAFFGFQRATADIEAFRVSNAYIVLDDFEFSANSQAVPEPLTIFGTATALGFGAMFKRKNAFNKEAK